MCIRCDERLPHDVPPACQGGRKPSYGQAALREGAGRPGSAAELTAAPFDRVLGQMRSHRLWVSPGRSQHATGIKNASGPPGRIVRSARVPSFAKYAAQQPLQTGSPSRSRLGIVPPNHWQNAGGLSIYGNRRGNFTVFYLHSSHLHDMI